MAEKCAIMHTSFENVSLSMFPLFKSPFIAAGCNTVASPAGASLDQPQLIAATNANLLERLGVLKFSFLERGGGGREGKKV